MGHFILVALVVCASALVESNNNNNNPQDFEVPPYRQSALDFKQASQKVLHLSPPAGGANPDYLDVDEKRRHYGMLVAMIDHLASVILNACGRSYEENYREAVDMGVSKGWSLPNEVGNVLTYEQKTLEAYLKDILTLVETECVLPVIDCDLEVEVAVRLDPQKYESQADLLLAVGELSKVYLSNTYAKQAETYDILRLLVTGRDELRELAVKAGTVRLRQPFSGGIEQKALECKF